MSRYLTVDVKGLLLLVGVWATNAFVLPTHQVNVIIMSTGYYRVTDFLKVGTGMTILFLTVSVLYVYFVY